MNSFVIPTKQKAAIMGRPGDIVIQEIPVEQPGPNDILVKIMAVGICGSDVHYYEHGRIGRYVVEQPIILGHECAGVVVAKGSEVTRVKIGDRVAVEPGEVCGRCVACKEGRYNLCPDVQFLATPPVNGAFLQYLRIREDNVFKIPTNMSFEDGAMLEPFSVGVQAAKRTNLQPGSTVLIMGMGPVGLLAVVAAKAFGAKKIIVGDLEPARLEAAKRLGATHVIDVKDQNPLAVVRDLTEERGVDVAWETAGNPKATQTALACLRRGGKLAIIGLSPQEEVPINTPFVVDNEIDVYGVFRYANTYPSGINFLSSGIADVSTIITDRYPLDSTKEAMERARTNKSGSLKIIVYPNN